MPGALRLETLPWVPTLGSAFPSTSHECRPGGSEPIRNPSSQAEMPLSNSPEKDQLKNEIKMGSREASEMRGGKDWRKGQGKEKQESGKCHAGLGRIKQLQRTWTLETDHAQVPGRQNLGLLINKMGAHLAQGLASRRRSVNSCCLVLKALEESPGSCSLSTLFAHNVSQEA